MSGPGSPLPALFLSGPGALCRGPALFVSGPGAPSLCRGPSVRVSVGAWRSSSGAVCVGAGALCVGAALFVSGPGARPPLRCCLSRVGVGAQRSSPKTLFSRYRRSVRCVWRFLSVCRGPTICVSGRRSLCRGPALFLSDSGALCQGVCGARTVSVSQLGALHRSLRRGPGVLASGPGALCQRPLPSGPRPSHQLPSACHPSGPASRGPPAPIRIRVPPIRHCVAFSRREPQTLLFGGKLSYCYYTTIISGATPLDYHATIL